MNENIISFWEDFCRMRSIPKGTPYSAWSFGNSKEMADELARLVNTGVKTATTSAYELYEIGEQVPQVGEYNIILDGQRKPVCITQTKVVYIMPYYLISAEHAWHEGEGDRSYKYWKRVHDQFFESEYKKCGKLFYEQAPMVCEVFEKVF